MSLIHQNASAYCLRLKLRVYIRIIKQENAWNKSQMHYKIYQCALHHFGRRSLKCLGNFDKDIKKDCIMPGLPISFSQTRFIIFL